MWKVQRRALRLLTPWFLVITLAACSPGGEPSHSPAPSSAAQPAPVRIVDDAGLEAALAARRGRGYLLNFWAIWCAPCVAELPELVEVAHAWRERGGEVVGVSYDLMIAGAEREDTLTEMRAFLDGRGIDLPILIYDELDFAAVDERYDLPGEIPVTLAVDKTGKIVDRQHGKAGKARFEEMMRRALGLAN